MFAYSVTVTEPLQDLLKLKDLETDVSGNGKVCHFIHGHKPIVQVRHQDNIPDMSGNGKVCHFIHGHKSIVQVRHQDNIPDNC